MSRIKYNNKIIILILPFMLDLLAIVADTLAIKKNQLPSRMIKNNPKNEQLNPGRFLD